MNTIRIVSLAAWLSVLAISMQAQELKPVSVGDRVPDITVEHIINYPVASTRISALKNKLVIIDFWGTTCVSCLAALPKIDSMQRKFGDKLQVLTVTNYDAEEKVKKTFSRINILKNVNLPIVLNDIKLKQLFPHEIISHVVWIDGMGVVRAITGSDYVTEENIQAMLAGASIDWPVKKDIQDFNYRQPLIKFAEENLAPPVFFNSAFMGHIDGVTATTATIADSTGNRVTYNYFNLTLLQLCDGSLSGEGTGYIDPKKLILDAADKERFINTSKYNTIWRKQHTYCYSTTIPMDFSKAQQREWIKKDLTHWLNLLGIKVAKQVREVDVLVLKRTADKRLQTKGGNEVFTLFDNGMKKMFNTPFSYFTGHLNNFVPGLPWIVDETGIPGSMRVDMEFGTESFQDLSMLKKELNYYGLDLVRAKRKMEVHIIRER